jgi:hypothetical protein
VFGGTCGGKPPLALSPGSPAAAFLVDPPAPSRRAAVTLPSRNDGAFVAILCENSLKTGYFRFLISMYVA